MVMMTVELVSPRLRGNLTKWMTEISAGVYVGKLNSMVRDLLWEAVIEEAGIAGRATMAFSTNSEQGYALRMHGESKRRVVELDGLQLVAVRHASWVDWKDHEDGLDD